jgi:hypothetical protein
MRGHQATREEIERRFGRNCVASKPSGRPVERFVAPDGRDLQVLRNPGRNGVDKLVAADGYASIRFWLSPTGDTALAWTAGDVAHFQLYGDLEDYGWHQCRIDLSDPARPVVAAQESALSVVLQGRACRRLAGGRFTVHTNVRTIDGDAVPCDPEAGPGPRP